MITVLTLADCVGTHTIRLLSSQYLKLTMAVTIVAVTIHRPIFPFYPPLDHLVHSLQYHSLSL